jgi:hypothetical protein
MRTPKIIDSLTRGGKMPRGTANKPGDTRVSPNGYHYTKTKERWRLTHHLIAEEALGRRLEPNERVSFRNGKKTDLRLENIMVQEKGFASWRRRLAILEAKRDEIEADIAEAKKALGL